MMENLFSKKHRLDVFKIDQRFVILANTRAVQIFLTGFVGANDESAKLFLQMN